MFIYETRFLSIADDGPIGGDTWLLYIRGKIRARNTSVHAGQARYVYVCSSSSKFRCIRTLRITDFNPFTPRRVSCYLLYIPED